MSCKLRSVHEDAMTVTLLDHIPDSDQPAPLVNFPIDHGTDEQED